MVLVVLVRFIGIEGFLLLNFPEELQTLNSSAGIQIPMTLNKLLGDDGKMHGTLLKETESSEKKGKGKGKAAAKPAAPAVTATKAAPAVPAKATAPPVLPKNAAPATPKPPVPAKKAMPATASPVPEASKAPAVPAPIAKLSTAPDPVPIRPAAESEIPPWRQARLVAKTGATPKVPPPKVPPPKVPPPAVSSGPASTTMQPDVDPLFKAVGLRSFLSATEWDEL